MAGSLERTLNRLRATPLSATLQRALKHSDRSRGVYPALAELARRYGEPPDLTAYELRVFSQNGEDGVLAELLRRTGVSGGGFVEFGAGDGGEGNTVFLAAVLGWPGVCIEPEPDAYAALERRHRANRRVRTLQAAVTAENVEDLFARAGVPAEPDVLSIDVDGDDYWIWRAMERVRPRIVVIEYNGALDLAEARVAPYRPDARWDHSAGYGASLAALEALGAEKGYSLAHTELAGVNAFFVRSDLGAELPEVVPRRAVNHALLGLEHPAPRRAPGWAPPPAR